MRFLSDSTERGRSIPDSHAGFPLLMWGLI